MRGSEFAELKAFAAVVERASFTRAADHLGLSPSAQEEGRQPALFKRLKSSDCFLP
jgi:Bacterial regulatory helix-turn-helix protein, lysR family